ncbi:hypothetical protein GS876_23410 [Rhodococcus hoagii]|nr:hypothetical protein [Prescottella equi]
MPGGSADFGLHGVREVANDTLPSDTIFWISSALLPYFLRGVEAGSAFEHLRHDFAVELALAADLAPDLAHLAEVGSGDRGASATMRELAFRAPHRLDAGCYEGAGQSGGSPSPNAVPFTEADAFRHDRFDVRGRVAET